MGANHSGRKLSFDENGEGEAVSGFEFTFHLILDWMCIHLQFDFIVKNI